MANGACAIFPCVVGFHFNNRLTTAIYFGMGSGCGQPSFGAGVVIGVFLAVGLAADRTDRRGRTGGFSAGVDGFFYFSAAGAELPMAGSVILPAALGRTGMRADRDSCGGGSEDRPIRLYTDLISTIGKSCYGIPRNLCPAGISGQLIFHRRINAGDLSIVLLGGGAVHLVNPCRRCRLGHINGLHFRVRGGRVIARLIYLYIIRRCYAGDLHGCAGNIIPCPAAVHAVFHGGIHIRQRTAVIACCGKCSAWRYFWRQGGLGCRQSNQLEFTGIVCFVVAVILLREQIE